MTSPNAIANIFKLLGVLVCASSGYGCVSEGPMRFSAVGISEIRAEYELIEERVEGQLCPEQGDALASYEHALDEALQQVQGANALIDVRFERSEKFGIICVNVTGDAVKL